MSTTPGQRASRGSKPPTMSRMLMQPTTIQRGPILRLKTYTRLRRVPVAQCKPLMVFPLMTSSLLVQSLPNIVSSVCPWLPTMCHWTLFLLIFSVHFRPNFTSHSLPHLSPLCLSLLRSSPYVFHAHEQTTRTQFDWYNWTPNNLSTGLPTFRNSPVVVPHHPDPVLEPPQPPLNAPTTQSSGLPGHGA